MQRLVLLLLRLAVGVYPAIRRRCLRTGTLAIAVLVTAAVVGIDTELTLTYQIFTLVLALVAVGVIGAWRFRGPFSVNRSLPPFATAGELLNYRIEVRNDSGRPQSGLSLIDELSDSRPGYEAFTETRNAVQAAIVSRGWRSLLTRRRSPYISPQPVPTLLPHDSFTAVMDFVPARRGVIEFAGVAVARPDPLGLFRAINLNDCHGSLLVLPKRYALPEVRLPGVRAYQHGGVTLTTSVGDSEEFMGLRDYRPGDPLQRIHWKSFARTGKPIVKEYQSEFFERHALVLDTFTGEESSPPFEEAVSLAASFVCTVETQENLLDLLFVGADVYCHTIGRGQLHAENLLEVLAHVRPCNDKPVAELRTAILGRRAALSGCILILIAWDEARRELVNVLRATGLPLVVYLVVPSRVRITEQEPWLHVLESGHIEEGLARSSSSPA